MWGGGRLLKIFEGVAYHTTPTLILMLEHTMSCSTITAAVYQAM